MTTPANAKLIVVGGLVAGALLMLLAAGAFYWGVLPVEDRVLRNSLAITFALFGAGDIVFSFFILTRR